MERSVRLLARLVAGGARTLIEAALPVGCAACAARLEPEVDLPLCAGCAAAAVEAGPAFCLSCARLRRDPGECRRSDHLRLRAGYTWNEPLRALVHAFKFGGAEALARPLVDATWATGGFADAGVPAAIVPVPLHRVRRRERGYDQADTLARAFAARAGAPCVSALARVRATRQQARLGARARAENVAGAFRVAHPEAIAGRRVALVDDVVTTGATVAAAAQALAGAGARSIEAWCVAHEPLE